MRALNSYSRFILFLAGWLVLLFPLLLGAKTTSLGERPEWEGLQDYSGVLESEEAMSALMSIYVPYADLKPWFVREEESLGVLREFRELPEGEVLPPESWERVAFAPSGKAKAAPRFWRKREEIDTLGDYEKPLKGLRLALDPGHIGGEFAKMEQRWFRLSVEDDPVAEGDMNLLLARKLKRRLENLGAEVFLLRDKAEPVTDKRPKDFEQLAAEILGAEDALLSGVAKGAPDASRVKRLSQLLFYRVSEIHARAVLVNEQFKPDVVLALHFNAFPWAKPGEPVLGKVNHTHVLVNGAYSEVEIAHEDIRYAMVERLMQGIYEEEIALADVLARSLAKHTELPPFHYAGENAVRVNDNPHVWARNLLANRLYRCPVVYLEPYCMNNEEVYARLQAGDFGGVQEVAGQERISIYEEYARGVEDALIAYYGIRSRDR